MSIKTTKRIALGVIASLVFAPIAVVAPASAGVVAATLSGPVRVSFTDTLRDAVSAQTFSFTPDANITAANTNDTTLTLTTAPTASAEVTVVVNGHTVSDTLGGAGTQVSNSAYTSNFVSGTAFTTGTIAVTGSNATAGTYAGTIVFQATTTETFSVTFSFTTTGKPTSLTFTSSASSITRAGVATLTATLKDAAGNTTQAGSSDSIDLSTVTIPTGSATLSVDPMTAANLADGTHTSVFTAPNSDGSTTVTATPLGTLPSQVTAQSVTIVHSGVIAATITAMEVTAPDNGVVTGGTATGADTDVQTGTASVTAKITGTALGVARLKLFLSGGGTINGSAATSAAPIYVNITLNALGEATATLTLAGNALLAGSRLTIQQVNADDSGSLFVHYVDQADSVVTAADITTTPSGTLLRKVGDVVPVTVSVADQFGNTYAGWTVRAFRGATAVTLLGSATTSAAGTATLNVTHSATAVAPATDSYSFEIQPPVGSTISKNAALTVKYTATGSVTELYVASTVGTSPLLATQSTAVAVMPYIYVPSDGTANTATSGAGYNVGLATGTAAGEVAVFTPTSIDATNITATASAGAYVSKSASTAWNKGTSSVTVENGAMVYVFATKVGTHTITFTANDKTVTAQIRVRNAATDGYNVAIAGPGAILTGSNNVVTVTVTDIFGNVVTQTGVATVTSSAPNVVLMGGLQTTATVNTGTAGTGTALVIAGSNAGSSTLTVAGADATAPAWVTGYVPPTGAPAPVKSATVTVAVEAPEVPAERPTLSAKKQGDRLILSGTAANEEGDIIIYVKRVGETTWVEKARTIEVAAPGDFNGSIKLKGKSFVIRVKQEGTGLFSNQVLVLIK